MSFDRYRLDPRPFRRGNSFFETSYSALHSYHYYPKCYELKKSGSKYTRGVSGEVIYENLLRQNTVVYFGQSGGLFSLRFDMTSSRRRRS